VEPDFEEELKRYTLAGLLACLQEVECRLGSPCERPDDLARAQLIAHRINNVYTVDMLLAALRAMPPRKPGQTKCE
jgi:hypothetical protein